MNIKDILELDNGDPVSSLDKCKVIKVGEVKEGANGDFQIITVSDEDDNELKIILRAEHYFVDEDKESMFTSILSGKPIKGVPAGLYFEVTPKGLRRLAVNEKCGTMKFWTGDESSKEDDNITIAGDVVPMPEPEQKSAPDTSKARKGPHDYVIKAYYEERMHIFNTLYYEHNRIGNPAFPVEKLAELATAVHINMDKAKMDILPPMSGKDKFTQPETDNNPPTKKAPMAEVTKNPSAKKQEAQSTENPIEQYIIDSVQEKHYQVKDSKGVMIGESFRDLPRRAKGIHWYLSSKESSMKEDSPALPVWKAIGKLIELAPSAIQKELILEGLRWDQSAIEAMVFDESNFDGFDKAVISIVKSTDGSVFNAKVPDYKEVARIYFSVDKDERIA